MDKKIVLDEYEQAIEDSLNKHVALNNDPALKAALMEAARNHIKMTIFKRNWEKVSDEHLLPQGTVEAMVSLAYPHKSLVSYNLISGGCANINIKIQLKDDNAPLILRIYLRDPGAAEVERSRAELLKPRVPIPSTYSIHSYKIYHFAIVEFMPGLSLRDVLLSATTQDIESLMFKVGETLANISKYQVSSWHVDDDRIAHDYMTSVREELDNIGDKLSADLIAHIEHVFEQNVMAIPNDTTHLTHGDFDPANILVDKIDGEWHVTGVLDWEFSSTGTMLWDVANMLRYAHRMPPIFATAFLNGLTYSHDVSIPDNWHTGADMLNLLSLLDLLARTDKRTCPNRYADIIELIQRIVVK